MSDSRETVGTSLMFFLLGAAVGAVVVALTTPKKGSELRADLKDMGNRVRERVGRMSSDLCGKAEEAAEEVTHG